MCRFPVHLKQMIIDIKVKGGMMNLKLKLLCGLGISVACLTACGPMYQTNYTFTPPSTWRGRQCINHCLQRRGFCRSQCSQHNQLCRAQADVLGAVRYSDYMHNHHPYRDGKHHYYQTRSISDFSNYSACHSDCGCEADYKVCYQNCGGTVTAHTVCVANCDKIKPRPIYRHRVR